MREPKDIEHRSLRERYEALKHRMRALFDANPDMIFRMDRRGRYLDFHSPNSQGLAFKPDEFLGKRVDDLFDAEFSAATHWWIDRALHTGSMQCWEYSLTLSGEPRDFEARIVPSGRNEIIAIVRDITANKRAREQVRLIEARLKRAQEVAKIGGWERDLVGNEVWWSDETYRLLQLDRETAVPGYATYLELVHPDDREHVGEVLRRSLETGMPYSSNHRLIFPDGTTKILHSRAEVECDAAGKPLRLVGTVQDITDQVDLEREIISVGERERERISRDLHDGLGQTLTGISLSLKALSNRLAKGQAPPGDIIRQLETNVLQAMQETRRVTHLLSPRISGLRAALDALAKQFDQPGTSCRAVSEADHDVHDAEIETHLYRIAQEATSNAVKHARASRIELRYRCDNKSVRLEIVDDGVGFSLAAASEGIGLRNMRYRAHMVNGSLDVESVPGGGTRVLCSCPCRGAAALRGLEGRETARR
ncbi:MAG TPA: PAS domain-containing protein [Gammaproteobacteria bacterium]|nr:PAS domain-containing protein [Gammaproteobacteria bacterium]